MTFIIDLASTLDISSYTGQNDIFSLAPNTTFRITGTKTIGTDIEGNPVFKYDQIYTTDGSGNLLIEDIIWDTYTITIPLSENRTLTGTNPLLPLSFIPNEEKTVSFATQVSTDNNLLFIVKNNEEAPIASVSAVISLAPSFSASASAGLISTNPNYSQIFFPDLTPGDYEFTIQSPEYDSKIGTVSVIGDTQDTITLSPQL
jgi:hypothetical protein